MDKKEELKKLKLLYNVIQDKTVQRRFDTTITVNMDTGEVSNKRLIDECEDYVVDRIKELVGDESNVKD